MAWNNGFPATYQQMAFPQYQTPMYQTQVPQPMQNAQPVQVNSRMVEIVPVDNEESAAGWPVSVGSTQAMMAKDDSFIAFKSVAVNGQTEFVLYDKRPPAPPAPAFDPKLYVRRDELETLVSAALAAHLEKGKEEKTK